MSTADLTSMQFVTLSLTSNTSAFAVDEPTLLMSSPRDQLTNKQLERRYEHEERVAVQAMESAQNTKLVLARRLEEKNR